MDGLAFLSEAANFIDEQPAIVDPAPPTSVHSPLRKKKVKLTTVGSSSLITSSSATTSSPTRPRNIAKSLSLTRSESIGKAISRTDSVNAGVGTPRTNKVLEHTPAIRMLLHGLSSPLVRRWCKYHFFYPNIDADYFAENEYLACLELLGLHKLLPDRNNDINNNNNNNCNSASDSGSDSASAAVIPKMTKYHWVAIRTLISNEIGCPRRFSPAFLMTERQKLVAYRDIVRTNQKLFIHKNLMTGAANKSTLNQVQRNNPANRQMINPTNPSYKCLADFRYRISNVLNVGDCVTAFSAQTDQLQRGQVLMTTNASDEARDGAFSSTPLQYVVQFQQSQLSCEFIRDDNLRLHGTTDITAGETRPVAGSSSNGNSGSGGIASSSGTGSRCSHYYILNKKRSYEEFCTPTTTSESDSGCSSGRYNNHFNVSPRAQAQARLQIQAQAQLQAYVQAQQDRTRMRLTAVAGAGADTGDTAVDTDMDADITTIASATNCTISAGDTVSASEPMNESAMEGLVQLLTVVIALIVTNTAQINQLKLCGVDSNTATILQMDAYICSLEKLAETQSEFAVITESNMMATAGGVNLLFVDCSQLPSENMLMLCRHIYDHLNRRPVAVSNLTIQTYIGLLEQVRRAIGFAVKNYSTKMTMTPTPTPAVATVE